MQLNWSTTSKESATGGIKMMVYGRAGSGKTTLCGTAPSPLIISAEAGLLALRRKNIPVLKVSSFQDALDALTWCRSEAFKSGIRTICLDSISEIAEKVLFSAKQKSKDPRQAYGELADKTIELVKDFRDLPSLHVLVTAKETATADPVTGATRASPSAPGQQIGPALPYLFDEVFHAATDKDSSGATYHYLRTRSSFNIDAKDRSGALDEIEFPDISNIINKIMTAA